MQSSMRRPLHKFWFASRNFSHFSPSKCTYSHISVFTALSRGILKKKSIPNSNVQNITSFKMEGGGRGREKNLLNCCNPLKRMKFVGGEENFSMPTCHALKFDLHDGRFLYSINTGSFRFTTIIYIMILTLNCK